jgi:hypothetical protein
VAEEFDTSWFDLRNYDGLKGIGLIEWCTQIDFRAYASMLFKAALFNADNKNLSEEQLESINQEVKRIIELIKANPIFAVPPAYTKDRWYRYDSKYPFNTHSVFSTSALSIWWDATNEGMADIWKNCKSYDDEGCVLLEHRNKEQVALVNTPFDLLYRESNADYDSSVHNVSINLEATDEQIMTDFRHWLTEYRKVIGYESRKKNFTDKDLALWVQWRLLPYIDLTLVATIENKETTQATAAWLIFSEDACKVDIVDRLRRTTKPKAEWLLRPETLSAIKAQLRSTAKRNKQSISA